jgi:hypothetical protein
VSYVSVLHYAAAIAIKAVLWHMQEDLAPHRWWKLGKSLEESLSLSLSLRFCYNFNVLVNTLDTDLQAVSCQVCCDECQLWVHVECDQMCSNMEVY